MSYAAARKAKLKISVTAKVIGQGTIVEYKAGKACQVQRNPSNLGMFIIYFSKTNIGQVPAELLPETIQYTNGNPEG